VKSRVAVVALLVPVLALVVMTSPMGAQAPSKKPNPCKVLLPTDLEPIFEQPFKKGVEQLGGSCAFGRLDDADVDVPDIIVSVIVEQKASVKAAKAAFARGEKVTRELAGGVETIGAMGDEAYYAVLIGHDVFAIRVDRIVAEVRVDQTDDPDAVFRDQAIAAGDIVEARITPVVPDETDKKGKGS
jgi:hypothetical protein